MALTLINQQNILDANKGLPPSTTNPRPSISLISMVHLAAMQFGDTFYETVKTFITFVVDPAFPTDPNKNIPKNINASSYVRKMYQVVDAANRRDERVIAALHGVVVTLLGKSTITIAQIGGATDAQWETFVENNIEKACERLAGINKDEKAQYLTPETS